MKRNLLLLALVPLLGLLSCETEDPVRVSGVRLAPANLNFAVINTFDATAQLNATVSPQDATNPTVRWNSSNEAVATVDGNGKVSIVGVGSTTITATTVDGGFTATSEVLVAQWATRNVDLSTANGFTANIGEPGMLFTWGTNVGISPTNPDNRHSNIWSGGKWVQVPSTELGFENGNTWTVAGNPCPTGWRVPTAAEFQTLLDMERVVISATRAGQMNLGNVEGMLFGASSSNVDFDAERHLFFPFIVIRDVDTGFEGVPFGNYWSSSVSGTFANSLTLTGNVQLSASGRHSGFPVRCVVE